MRTSSFVSAETQTSNPHASRAGQLRSGLSATRACRGNSNCLDARRHSSKLLSKRDWCTKVVAARAERLGRGRHHVWPAAHRERFVASPCWPHRAAATGSSIGANLSAPAGRLWPIRARSRKSGSSASWGVWPVGAPVSAAAQARRGGLQAREESSAQAARAGAANALEVRSTGGLRT